MIWLNSSLEFLRARESQKTWDTPQGVPENMGPTSYTEGLKNDAIQVTVRPNHNPSHS